jgi:hypothetical protein
MVGNKFGQWTIIKYLYPKKSYNYYLLKCDCGYEKIANSAHLRHSSKCYKCAGKINSERMKKEYGLCSKNTVLSGYKKGAEYRNYKWNLKDTEALALMSKTCYYCGKEPFREYIASRANGGFVYNGIDRIDNNLGYEIDNCRSCCKQCNYMKYSMSETEFFNHIRLIYENLNLKGTLP